MKMEERRITLPYFAKINSVSKNSILFDDIHTVLAWQILEQYTQIPIEHITVERVKSSKSLVDIKLTVRACQEHYQNGVDSFIIVSSDSDYWGLISSLPTAHFLVMIEREKCGVDMKEAMLGSGIFYCYIDDFNARGADEIKAAALFKELNHRITQSLNLNMKQLLDSALLATRIEMNKVEYQQFFNRHIKPMDVSICHTG